jgi:transcriptional regulator GlxA family with amidase domain
LLDLRRVPADSRSAWPSRRPLAIYWRAKDLEDARYVGDLARAAGPSRAHFSREFRRAFGESPHAYLLTRRLERPAALLRRTDHSVADVCLSVGLQSVGSFAEMDAETAEQVRGLMAKGFAGTVFLTTDDCRASYEELKGGGV